MENHDNITRRTAMAGVAAAALAVAVPANAADVPNPKITDLIGKHRTAYAVYSAALSAWDQANSAFANRPNPRAPMALDPEGVCVSGYYEFGVVSEADIRKGIRDTHASLRRIHCSKWTQRMVPAFTEAIAAEIDASEDRALAALDAIVAQQRADYEAFGVEATDAAVANAGKQERTALAGILAHRPMSMAERDLKLAYIDSHEEFIGTDIFEDEGLGAALVIALNEVM